MENVKSTDGIDLSNALFGKSVERPTPLFWEYGVHGSLKPGKAEHTSPQLAIRDGVWKLLCNPDGSDSQLYNLKADIGERDNLSQQNVDVAQRMQKRLLDWWNQMDAFYKSIPTARVF
ncbi:MAG: hypothetical protein AAF497_15845, partial [Planctomycetota bacterium]